MSSELSASKRYSLADASNGESRKRPGGSTGRCRRLDIEWLLALQKKRKSERIRQGRFVSEEAIPRRSVIEESNLIDDLKSQSFTIGLARTLIRSTDSFDVRIWLVDNSGSMNNIDGHLVVQSKDPPCNIKNVSCSRWEEVVSTVLWHAQFNAKLEAPMVMRLVNDPGSNVGPQQLGVAASEHIKVEEELQRLRKLLQCHPGGNTPLTIHLKDILESLKMVDPEFLIDKMISIVIVTDRLPTDAEGQEDDDVSQDFLDTLKEFRRYPVWIVVRLSTDEQRVVDFYSNLDRGTRIDKREGELSVIQGEKAQLDVLDDFVSEASQVTKYNPWINYAYPLHLARESGVTFEVFDAINDRPLDYNELADFVALLFDRNDDGVGEELRTVDDKPLHDPRSDYKSFRKEVQELTGRNGELWNPIRKKIMPWIDLKELDRIYSSGEPITATVVETKATCSCQIL